MLHFVQNGTNLGIVKICFLYILARRGTLILISPIFVPFVSQADLIVSISGIPAPMIRLRNQHLATTSILIGQHDLHPKDSGARYELTRTR